MKNVVYENLAQMQLLKLFESGRVSDEAIKQEWKRRHAMEFPYGTDLSGNIRNYLIDMLITDDEADPLILKQAERLREKRRERAIR